VHGYDMTCVAPISSSCFASGADEKVIRVFKTSKQFLSHLKSLCGIELQGNYF
jgi:elongator complex protein 2